VYGGTARRTLLRVIDEEIGALTLNSNVQPYPSLGFFHFSSSEVMNLALCIPIFYFVDGGYWQCGNQCSSPNYSTYIGSSSDTWQNNFSRPCRHMYLLILISVDCAVVFCTNMNWEHENGINWVIILFARNMKSQLNNPYGGGRI
jgi:hypothetical protein